MAGFFDKNDEHKEGGGFFDKKDEAPPLAPEGDSILHAAGGVLNQILDGAKQAGGTLLAPLTEMDKVTGAPLRAGMGAYQHGRGLGGAADAFVDQITAGLPSMGPNGPERGKLLPTVPTGADIATAGMMQHGFKEPDARAMSGIPGAMTDAALDMTNFIPFDLGAQAVGGASKLLGKGVDLAAGAAGAVERGVAKPLFGVGSMLTAGNINYDKALRAANVLKSYELIAPGTKDFGQLSRSIDIVGKARAELGSANLTVPGSHAAANDALALVDTAIGRTMPTLRPNAESLKQFINDRMFEEVTRVEPVPLPEIEQAYEGAKAHLNDVQNQYRSMANEYNTAKHAFLDHAEKLKGSPLTGDEIKTGSTTFHGANFDAGMKVTQGYRDFNAAQDTVDQIAKGYQSHLAGQPVFTREVKSIQPKDLTLDEIDDVIVNLDNLVYTGLGNERLPKAIWTPAVRQSRRILNESLNSVPEGMLFQDLKSRHEGLSTASKGRSKLLDSLGTASAVGGGAGTLGTFATGGDVSVAALMSLVGGLSIKPGSYYKIMGAAKVPGDMARAVQAAADSGRLAVMRDVITDMAKKYPLATEGLVRGVALAASKPEGRQILTSEDVKNLYKPKSFDPEVIAQTAQRLKDDPDTPSVMKARLLSQIAENGYVLLPNQPADEGAPAPETRAQRVEGGLKDIIRSLKAGNGQ